MNLIELCSKLSATPLDQVTLPSYLLGAFRRKSISFANGLSDEQTIVYWFQSKSFTIDLRLKNAKSTPILERQGWIGDTLWNDEEQQLSWNVTSNYQNHVQWPEPARLHSVGNAIFEFSPSNAYVEDWRQQATRGLYLGLRLFKIENEETKTSYSADGGLIICDHFMAYTKARQPDIQQRFELCESLNDGFTHQKISAQDIQNYEVSISFDDQIIDLSTVTNRLGEKIDLDHFEIFDENTLVQKQVIDGEASLLYYKIDIYQPDYFFTTITQTSSESMNWYTDEKNHLFHHAKITL